MNRHFLFSLIYISKLAESTTENNNVGLFYNSQILARTQGARTGRCGLIGGSSLDDLMSIKQSGCVHGVNDRLQIGASQRDPKDTLSVFWLVNTVCTDKPPLTRHTSVWALI